MWKGPLAALVGVFLMSVKVMAAPEITGNETELAAMLNGVEKTVEIQVAVTQPIQTESSRVTLVVNSEAEKLAAALSDNRQQRNSLVTKMKQAGISEEAIKQSKFSSVPEYGMFGDEPKSYQVSNLVHIHVLNEEQMIAVAHLADTSPAVRFVESQPVVGDIQKIKQALLARAMTDAMTRVTFYEEKLGVSLTPSSFKEAYTQVRPIRTTKTDRKFASLDAYPKSNALGAWEQTLELTITYRLGAIR